MALFCLKNFDTGPSWYMLADKHSTYTRKAQTLKSTWPVDSVPLASEYCHLKRDEAAEVKMLVVCVRTSCRRKILLLDVWKHS